MDMQRSFSILDHRVIVETDQPDLFERLDDIVVVTHDTIQLRREINLRLLRADGFIRIEYRGQIRAQETDPAAAIRMLHLLINQFVLEPQSETLKLHAAAGTWQGRFFFVTGNRGAGKTTLLVKMMLDGAEMHCDETVLMLDGQIQTYPRKFYIKDSSLQCLPRVKEVCATKRSYPGFFGGRLFFADPTDFGLPWHNRTGQPQAIFHLTPAFDQPPWLEPCPKVDMAKYLLLQTQNMAGDLGQHIARLCRLLENCRCYSLRVGALDATADLLKKTLLA